MRVVAQILSILLYPMLIPAYAMGLLCYAFQHTGMPLPTAYIWVAVLGTFILTCCIPFSAILLLLKRGNITDIYLRNPQERKTPYLYSLFACGFWCYFLHSTLHMPPIIVWMAVASTVVLLCIMIITRWWKISAHLAFMGTWIAAVVGYSWHTAIFPLWLIVGLLGMALLLMYARIYLKQHTPAQVITGFLLGFVFTLLPALFL